LRFATSEEINSAADSSYIDSSKLSYMQSIQCPTNPVPKCVKCIDTGEVFISIQSIADALGVSNSAVTAAIVSPHLCKGYTLCFLDQFTDANCEYDYMIWLRQRSTSNRGVSYWRGRDIHSSMPAIKPKKEV
jgi:hypothetical protein